MNQKQYNLEIKRANKLQSMGTSLEKEFWAGYIHGINRVFFGYQYIDDEKHDACMLQYAKSSILPVQVYGIGYRSGYLHSSIGARGRPKKNYGGELPTIKVAIEMLAEIKSDAEKKEVSVSDWRRSAYKLKLEDG